jgi:multisubunit Na+/H+ antiporter MnhB subunit
MRDLQELWRAFDPRQRLAAAAALALFATMFLPWYTKDTSVVVGGRLQKVDDTLFAFEAFTFVEAAVLLVAVATLAMLVARVRGGAFHLPGGDGLIVTAAGAWVCLLVFYRQLDKPDGSKSGEFATDYGVTWGIFVTFLCGALLTYAGWRLRAAHLTEPPLPAAIPTAASAAVTATAPTRVAPVGARHMPRDGGEQLSFDEDRPTP